MTKNQKQLILAVVLVTAFIGNVARQLIFHGRAAAPAAVANTDTAPNQIVDEARFMASVRASDKLLNEQWERWGPEWERDPFHLDDLQGAPTIENMALKGVYWDERNPKAVINNKTLALGESIDGYKVMEIRPSSVVLWTGERNLELSVFRSPLAPGITDLDAGAQEATDHSRTDEMMRQAESS